MQALLGSRVVSQPTQVQPQKGTVQKVWNKAGAVARQPGYMVGRSINATADILTAPVYGATNPGAFITISGIPPQSPVVSQVASIAGSNAVQGGSC